MCTMDHSAVPEEKAPAALPEVEAAEEATAIRGAEETPEASVEIPQEPQAPRVEPDPEEAPRPAFDASAAAQALDGSFGRVSQGMQDVTDAFLNLQAPLQAMIQEVSRCSGALAQLRDSAEGAQWDAGLQKLCKLCRVLELKQDKSEETAVWLEHLQSILEEDFGLERFCPAPGDVYQAQLAERVRADLPLGLVEQCLAPGWSRRGAVLLRAIVTTIHPDGKEQE